MGNRFHSVFALVLLSYCCVSATLLTKRALPTNEKCDPFLQVCRKGDWISEDIAACEYRDSMATCKATNTLNWIVDEDINNNCRPSQNLAFTCGDPGTHTRCVCSDTNLFYNIFRNAPLHNQCKCQYWPEEDIGSKFPAFCTGYYIGGKTGLHHWICCDNCHDQEVNTCDGITWQGGSDLDYCDACGKNTGNGRVKYYFNCGSCTEQQRCRKECSSPIWLTRPGLCWKWADCFRDCCLKLPQGTF